LAGLLVGDRLARAHLLLQQDHAPVEIAGDDGHLIEPPFARGQAAFKLDLLIC
jgi:hypothetical protein